MTYNYLLTAMLVFILSLAARILAGRGVIQSHDSRAHLYYALRLKKENGGPFSAVSTDVVTSSPFYNPFMWHWLISLLPVRSVMKYQSIANPLLDAFFSVFVFYVAFAIGFSYQEAWIAVLLYIATPMWFSRLSIGPRTNSFTPRLSGELATNCFFVFSCLPLGLADTVAILLAVLCGFFVLTSSKFGVQALLFLTPLVSLLTGIIEPLLNLFLSVLFAIVFSKGAFFNSLSKQLEHLTWFFFKNLKGDMPVSNRNRFGFEYAKRENEPISRYFLRVFYLLCSGNSFTGVLIKMPILILVLCGVFVFGIDATPVVFIMPVFSAMMVFLLINVPQLLFLGEAERYLNHAAVFIILSAIYLSRELGWESYLWGIVAYGLCFLLGEGLVLPKILARSRKAQEDSDADKVIEFLTEVPETVVLNFPFHACHGFYRVMTETHHKTVFIGGTISIAKRYSEKFSSKHPYVKLERLDDMRTDLGVTVAVLNNASIKRTMGENWAPPKGWDLVNVGCSLNSVYIFR